MKKPKRILAIAFAVVLIVTAAGVMTPSPVQAYQLNAVGTAWQTGDAFPTTIQNGGFETYYQISGSWSGTGSSQGATTALTVEDIPGWNTTDPVGDIELWANSFAPAALPGYVQFNSHSGNYYAEINAATPGEVLYQDLSTTPGGLYQWSFYHLGRGTNTNPNSHNIDVAQIYLASQYESGDSIPKGDPQPAFNTDYNGYTNVETVGGTGDTDLTMLQAPSIDRGANAANPTVVTPNDWTYHMGYYSVPEGQTVTSYMLYSYNTASAGMRGASGNLVDDIAWEPIALPATQYIYVGDTPTYSGADMTSFVASGYEAEAPDFSGFPKATPGTYTVNVPIDLDDGTTFVGDVESTIIVLPVLTVTYVDENGAQLTNIVDSSNNAIANPTTTKNSAPASNPSEAYNVTTPSAVITASGVYYHYVGLYNSGGLSSDTLSGNYYATDDTNLDSYGNPVLVNRNVILEYEKQYALNVEYVDPSGNLIGLAASMALFSDGDSYDVTTAVPLPGDIVTVNGKKYTYQELYQEGSPSGSDDPSGTMDSNKTVMMVLIPVANTPTAKTSSSSSSSGGGSSLSPQTGDTFSLGMWVIALIVSSAIVILLAVLWLMRRYRYKAKHAAAKRSA